MKLEDMKTTADALRWALHRLETAGVDCGDYFAQADAILAQQSRPYVSDEASKGEYAAQCLPPLPEPKTIGSSRYGSLFKGYEAGDMRAYARAYAAEQVRELVEALRRIVDWDAAGMALTADHIAQACAVLAKQKEQA